MWKEKKGECSGQQSWGNPKRLGLESSFGPGRRSPVTLVIQFIFSKHMLKSYYMAGTVLRARDVLSNNYILVKGNS